MNGIEIYRDISLKMFGESNWLAKYRVINIEMILKIHISQTTNRRRLKHNCTL